MSEAKTPSRSLVGSTLSRGLKLNRSAARAAVNGFDWAFRRDSLIRSGKTWFELVHDTDLMSVRYYGLPDESMIELSDGSTMPVERQQQPVPLVLVPPLGVTANTFDLMPNRSLARFMAARGFRTYMIDWGKPTKEHDGELSMVDYSGRLMTEALEAIRAHSGTNEVSLMGWCMGGLISIIHMGLHGTDGIRNLVTAASPVDIRSSRAVLGLGDALDAPAHLIERMFEFTGLADKPGALSVPPWLTALSFKMTAPVSSITTYWDLLMGLGDREFVVNYTTTSDYLNNMYMYPGGVVRDVVVQVAGHNKLASGKIELGGTVADLSRVDIPTLVFAGKTDHLVEVPVARALIDIVSSEDKQFRVAQGGHMGVILGRKALGDLWEPAASWLAERSAA